VLLSDFNYELPPELIAQAPLPERDASRMLIVEREHSRWRDAEFRSFPDQLSGDELIVVNDARVIPARLFGRRLGAGSEKPGKSRRTATEFLTSPIEVLLTRQMAPNEWEALVRPGRKIRVGERIEFGAGELSAEVLDRGEYGLRRIRLSSTGDIPQTIERLGHVPLPPYISREDEPADRERYQTIFAQRPGAVAAPTAGLHFSPAILERLRLRGIRMASITLDVGLGTFQPIHEEEIDRHQIHSERYEISETAASAICEAKREHRPIVAVGTTVVRALEDAAQKSAARYEEGKSPAGSLIEPGPTEAAIFIKPGRRFRVVDQLLTNFHLPQSTLLVLVSAFAGREFILQAYQHAVEERYRFYSYGDCMWIR
jgi:S-adenosylmethionine:tRNA ribosyltransferase-isomerase